MTGKSYESNYYFGKTKERSSNYEKMCVCDLNHKII